MTYAGLLLMAMSGRGRMHNEQIYLRVRRAAKKEKFPLSLHWRATVRNTLQRHSRQSDKFVPPSLFVHHDYNIWECKR